MANPATEESFRRLVEKQGAMLELHCRRMLGSPHDAEDALQEALLRAWRGLPGYQGHSSLHAWIHRIATNACIDVIARRPKEAIPIDHGPAAETYRRRESEEEAPGPAVRYEQREALERAFSAAFEHLPARQRTVLILRDGLGFSAKEVAPILETTVAATNSVLQRARAAFQESIPAQGRARTRVVEQLVDAFEEGDVGTILAIAAHG